MNRKAVALLVFVAIIALSISQLGSQSNQPAISIATIPGWGQDGQIAGSVYGAGSQQMSLYLFAFLPDLGWAGLPSTCSPVPVQSGQFSINASPNIVFRSATRFTAYLVPATLSPNCGSGTATVPFLIQHNALATVTYPRLPQYSTLSFAGLDWYVKDAPVQVYPGPQFFVKDNAYVDSAGQLHLKISQCGDSWCAAEIYTKQSVGYGTYRFTINSQLSNLDPNVTLGLFSWDAQAGDQNNHEWDIEFSRWGNAAATTNAQYVVQPYGGPNNIQHFVMSASAPSAHIVTWSPAQIGFVSSTSANSLISQWNFAGVATPVPTPGDVHLHLNFYTASGQAPSVRATQEVVISAFQYSPATPQIGFSRVADSVPFQGNSYNVPLVATTSTCSAMVESDSPWLSVTGSNVVPPGLSLQYAVADNLGSPRSGNLILQSSACNATLGTQILTVNQAGLVCAPSFAIPSTHVGFLDSVFSVAIKGTASACTWTVSSSSAWLRIQSGASGAGDGTLQATADSNSTASLRGAVLALNNGPIHSVYQDGAGAFFALSPLTASPCGSQSAQFGVSWSAQSNIEIHLNSPTGPLVGQYGQSGTAALPGITDGTLIYMMGLAGSLTPSTLASARATVLTSNCNGASIAPLGLVNGASYSANSLAPGSLATAFGSNLSQTTAQAAGSSYPTTLAGVTVSLGGQPCPLWYVSPHQINFAVPANLAPGRYTLTIGPASSDVLITNVSPGIFTLRGDGTGVPLAAVSGVVGDGSIVPLPPYQCSSTGCSAVPITLPDGLTDLYIVLYGTGIRNYGTISATLGSLKAEIDYAAPQGSYPGLDQINLHLRGPITLTGLQPLNLVVDGMNSNGVALLFR